MINTMLAFLRAWVRIISISVQASLRAARSGQLVAPLLVAGSGQRAALFLLFLSACTGDRQAPESSEDNGALETDAVVLRVPRVGGTITAAVYPRIDSVVWRAPQTPAIRNVLGFDAEAGTIAVVTNAGLPARIDLRLGRSAVASRTRMQSLSSANGSDIYGVDDKGNVVRLSPAGTWRFEPPSRARSVYPQPDGSIVVASALGAQTTLWKIVPPDDRAIDTAYLPPVGRSVRTQLGDLLYFATDTALVGVRVRELELTNSIKLRGRPAALAPTPSGDRLYVVSASDPSMRVVNRFGGGAQEVVLPGRASDLRMDALGRYLLVRPAEGDSAWVVDVGASRVLGTLPTLWTADLPAVAPDGSIATIDGQDVVFVGAQEGETRRRVRSGARDFWMFVWWNGFRPRAAGIDRPVTFAAGDSVPDSITADSAAPPGQTAPADTAPAQPPPPPQARAARFTLSFAALLSQIRAQAIADSLNAAGIRVRVAMTERAGTPVYRVVAGPFDTRAEAEAAGRASRRTYWIYEEQQ